MNDLKPAIPWVIFAIICLSLGHYLTKDDPKKPPCDSAYTGYMSDIDC